MHSTRDVPYWRQLRRHIDRTAWRQGWRGDGDELCPPPLRTLRQRLQAAELLLDTTAGVGRLSERLRRLAARRCEVIVATHLPAPPKTRPPRRSTPARRGPASPVLLPSDSSTEVAVG